MIQLPNIPYSCQPPSSGIIGTIGCPDNNAWHEQVARYHAAERGGLKCPSCGLIHCAIPDDEVYRFPTGGYLHESVQCVPQEPPLPTQPPTAKPSRSSIPYIGGIVGACGLYTMCFLSDTWWAEALLAVGVFIIYVRWYRSL